MRCPKIFFKNAIFPIILLHKILGGRRVAFHKNFIGGRG
jgi:hypothetical protein